MSESVVFLVVEDYEANQLLFCSVLEREGYRVDVAASSAEALQRLSVRRPSLILMDIQLGGEDGLALAARLKADPATAMIPIVALTAHAMKGADLQCAAAGMDDYLSKPIDRELLQQVLNRWLNDSEDAVATVEPPASQR